MISKIESKFLGIINGVEIHREFVYNTTEYVFYLIEDVFKKSTDEEKDLVSAFAGSLERLWLKQDFDIADFENYVGGNIKNKKIFIPANDPEYRGEFFEKANELLKNFLEDEERICIRCHGLVGDAKVCPNCGETDIVRTKDLTE